MATKEQVNMLLEKLHESNPIEVFQCTNETHAGIGAVLRLLNESGGLITAGKISDELGISTARVAVLLKKMATKGLITKERSSTDARVTVVKLTDFGEKTIKEIFGEVFRVASHLIDTVGEERLVEFLNISYEIKKSMEMIQIKSPAEGRV